MPVQHIFDRPLSLSPMGWPNPYLCRIALYDPQAQPIYARVRELNASLCWPQLVYIKFSSIKMSHRTQILLNFPHNLILSLHIKFKDFYHFFMVY